MQDPPSGVALGIDYGTSNTVAVLRWPDGRVRPVLFDGSPLLPSAVYREPDGTLLAGRDAVHSARLAPASYEPYPKSRAGDGILLLGDTEVPVAEAVAATLRLVSGEARRAVGAVPDTVILTYPAAWAASRRGVLHTGASLAGLPAPRLVPEPVAAAAYFTSVLGHRLGPGQQLVVYDLGAGTFDVSAVRRTADGYEVVDVDGLASFGGLDLDELVVQQVGAAVAGGDPDVWRRLTAPTTAADRRAFRTLWDDARAAKETLSRRSAAGLFVPLFDRDVQIAREEFEAAAGPKLARAAELTARLISRCGIGPTELAGIFLVGGSSRVPLAATTVHRATRVAPDALDQPETVVAEGALRTAAIAGSSDQGGGVPGASQPGVVGSGIVGPGAAVSTLVGPAPGRSSVVGSTVDADPMTEFGSVAPAEAAGFSPPVGEQHSAGPDPRAVSGSAPADGRVGWPSWRPFVGAFALGFAGWMLPYRTVLPQWLVTVAVVGGSVALATFAAVAWVRPWLRWKPPSGTERPAPAPLIAAAVVLSLFGSTGSVATALLLPYLLEGRSPLAGDPVSVVIWLVCVPLAVGAVAVVHRQVADLPGGMPLSSPLPDWACLGWSLLTGTLLELMYSTSLAFPFAVNVALAALVVLAATMAFTRRVAGSPFAPRSLGAVLAGGALLAMSGTAVALAGGSLVRSVLAARFHEVPWEVVVAVPGAVLAAFAVALVRHGARRGDGGSPVDAGH